MTDEYEVEDKPKRNIFTPGFLESMGLKGGREVSSVVPQLPKDIPVSDDEFQKVLTDKESLAPESMKQNEHVEYDASSVDMTMRHVNKTPRLNVTKARKRDQKTQSMGFLPNGYGTVYACDSAEARKNFESRDRQKNRYAVRALVLLRDKGMCQVCHEACSVDGEVVARKPYKEGGQFDEGNCVTICSECMKVWDKYKNFYSGSEMDEFCRLRQYLWVMKRRASGRKGKVDVKVLSDVGMTRYREVMRKVEEFELREAMDRVQQEKGLGKRLDTRGMTQEEKVMAILSPLRNRDNKSDIKLSENDNNGTEGEESTD